MRVRNAIAIFIGPLHSFVWCQVLFQTLFSLPWCIIVLFTIYHSLFTIYDRIQAKGFCKLHVLWKYNQKVNSFPVPHLFTQFLPLSFFYFCYTHTHTHTHKQLPPKKRKKQTKSLGTSLWLWFCTGNAEVLGSIAGQGNRSHRLHLRPPGSQIINK